MTRRRKQCGPATVLSGEGVAARWCVLDARPRHTFHLLMEPLEAHALTEAERAVAIATFKVKVAEAQLADAKTELRDAKRKAVP